MKKVVLGLSVLALALTSCGTKQKLADLEAKNKETQDLLNTCTIKLNSALAERNAFSKEIDHLKKNNSDLLSNMGNMTMLSSKGAENLEKTLESMKEKDLKITRLQDAITKKDSVTLALVRSVKKEVGFDDPDISVNVEKGVVYISIADKLLFKTAGYEVSTDAKRVLAKVAAIAKSKPDFEVMVEGHTDNVSIKNAMMRDNWDLSVKRAVSIVQVLQNDFQLNPGQLVASGRGEYVPLVENDTPENKARNRRTRILLLPKIDQFYDMIEKEMKNMTK
ncbi:OmpA/MotB family protein [Myroides marinus]|uniref:Chemotaxis protein MotB n=1 Tax=Myroides marinus TaxID=703342 RepID=A0A1H6SPE0_9FLAO|nr:OmpA family protein [Myroides marinus]MDM1349601.1 OmpA family protein [Myroides marinus]MDM1356810.1 OmpA family protein [Myroides marinus]MDM1379504.1 OmpA family protein [Myroides marinus]MDM1386775.1 OmpA family protein [Myroides marinus]MDM1393988.1 OmpA family protein [Myroides marinus]